MGQLEDNGYVRELRSRFPFGVFLESRGAIEDFETIRQSKNIIISISTFSWLAAYLSDATCVVMPIMGFLNPQQRPDIDLLPINDCRYEFYSFPTTIAARGDEYQKAHAMIDGQWRKGLPQLP
jgi:Glycosyl transferase family 11